MSNLIDQMIKENHAGMGACEQKYVIESKPQRNLWRSLAIQRGSHIGKSKLGWIHTLPETNGWNPKPWRLGSDDFPFQKGDFQVPAVSFREGKPGGLIFENHHKKYTVDPLLASTRNITELLGPRKPIPISFLGRPGVCDTVAAWISCIPCGTLLSNVTPLCPLKRCKKICSTSN